jgi:hypothetical protein
MQWMERSASYLATICTRPKFESPLIRCTLPLSISLSNSVISVVSSGALRSLDLESAFASLTSCSNVL